MLHQFLCVVFLADGKHISQNEVCDSATEAMERAEKWRSLGHKAQAFLQAVDTDNCEIYLFPLN